LATGKLNQFWVLISLLLIVVIVIGGIILWQNLKPTPPIEISLPQETAAADEFTPTAEEPQKIDINCAEAWLLEALPGIGPSKAQAIIDYRQQYGYFTDTFEITNVPGISITMYQDFQDMITVGD
jgi:competence ComEA-like helix-hairpin-helix protein